MIQKLIQLGSNPECSLNCFLHEKGWGNEARPAVIVCPGGAYSFFTPSEAEPVAAPLCCATP